MTDPRDASWRPSTSTMFRSRNPLAITAAVVGLFSLMLNPFFLSGAAALVLGALGLRVAGRLKAADTAADSVDRHVDTVAGESSERDDFDDAIPLVQPTPPATGAAYALWAIVFGGLATLYALVKLWLFPG